MKAVSQSVQRLRNYTMFLLHKRWLQFCSKSELPFKAGLMTHPVVFHPLPFLFAFLSLSLSLCSFSMLWVWQIDTYVMLLLCLFGLMVGCAVQIPEKWVYQTHPAWQAWTGRLSFSLLASTETCTTSYQCRPTQTLSNHRSQPIFETHNHLPNSNFLSCMETVLFIFPGSLCRWAEPLHSWPIRTLPHLEEGHQLLKWRTGRS